MVAYALVCVGERLRSPVEALKKVALMNDAQVENPFGAVLARAEEETPAGVCTSQLLIALRRVKEQGGVDPEAPVATFSSAF